MASFSVINLLGLLLFCVQQAFGYEVCSRTATAKFYCNDGYYCCHYNKKCCAYGQHVSVSVGGWSGIIIGIIAFIVFLVVVCVLVCRRHRGRPGMVNRPGPVVTTISGTSQYPMGNAGAPPQYYAQ